jgi:penicillin-binding protein 1C
MRGFRIPRLSRDPADKRRRRIVAAASILGLIALTLAVDAANPPDMSRYTHVSPEVLASDGKLLRPFLTKDGFWRLRTDVRQVSPRYLAILKGYEDRHYDSHYGIDLLAVGRAAKQYLTAGAHVVSGASTLTMQTARLLEGPRPRSLANKFFQMVRAFQLEERYSKDQILSIYLTLAPMGGNLEGVRAASLAYFNKEPSMLDLSEAALLVALPQSPARLRPDRHAINAKAGRDKVLKRMIGESVVTAGDVAVAMKEGVAYQRQAMPLHAPHFAQALVLAEPERTRIVSTIDYDAQDALERLVATESTYMDDGAGMAIVVADNKMRGIRAYIGGTNYWGAAGQVDLARRPRSPGSALKPFIYGMAFDDLFLHPATMMSDQATMFGDYAPRDFEGAFQGQVSATQALRMSLNVPAVMVLERVGPLRFTLNLTNAGAHIAFPTRDTAPTLPVALGGLGISLTDITMLYTGIANGGTVRPLRSDNDAPQGNSKRLFGPVAAYYLRQILAGVNLPEGWAMGQGLTKNRTIAFKTGTSYGFRDAWSVGFSNDYTVGVWVGRADGTPRAGRIGREAAAPILLRTFQLLPADKQDDPVPPAGTIMATLADQLPEGLRTFTRAQVEAAPKVTEIPPPTISFPPNGSTVPLAAADAPDKTIMLKATGGREPLTWLVNGELIGSYDRFQPAFYTPTGEGFAHVTVVDSQGRSDSAEIRFKKAKS